LTIELYDLIQFAFNMVNPISRSSYVFGVLIPISSSQDFFTFFCWHFLQFIYCYCIFFTYLYISTELIKSNRVNDPSSVLFFFKYRNACIILTSFSSTFKKLGRSMTLERPIKCKAKIKGYLRLSFNLLFVKIWFFFL
jgi:hypothetical protein